MGTTARQVFQTNKTEDLLQVLGVGQLLSITTDSTPDTESTHAHTLGRVPRGFIVFGQDKAGSVYDGTGHSSTLLKVKCDVASVTALVWVF